MQRTDSISPVRVILLILGVALAVEAAIMLLLSIVDAPEDSLWVFLLDAMLLVLLLCPVLWLFVLRPLRRVIAERGDLLAQSLSVQEEERTRIARDLHDELGQAQTAILLGLRSIEGASTLDEARERAADVRAMAANAVDTIRRLARGLSPAVLHDLGLGVAVERVCEDMTSGTPIRIDRAIEIGERRFDPAVEIAAYRVIQEALTNAVRHSGARRLAVRVRSHRTLDLAVEDDGQGLVPGTADVRAAGTGAGLGVAGMRERVVSVGGRFWIESAPGRGTVVRASIPIHAPPSQPPARHP